MASVHSQYRRHFKSPSWDDFAISEYNRKRDYRIGRRSVEHRHQPLEWDSYESENSDDNVESKHEKLEKETQRHAAKPSKDERTERRVCKDKSSKELSDPGKRPAKQAWAEVELEDSNVCKERFNKEMTTQTINRKQSKHRKSKGKKKAKSKTEGDGRKWVNEGERLNDRVPPFVSYGWANDAPIEKKYTHNVRADPKDVYPASLRALKRHQLNIAKRLDENKKKEKVQLEQEMLKEKFFNLTHISPLFMTEYQRSYCSMDCRNT